MFKSELSGLVVNQSSELSSSTESMAWVLREAKERMPFFSFSSLPGFGENGGSFSELVSAISQRERSLSKFWNSTNEQWVTVYLSNQSSILE